MSGEISKAAKKGGRPTNRDRATSSFYKPYEMWLTLRMLAEYAASLDLEPSAADDSPQAKILVRALNEFLRKKQELLRLKGTDHSEYFFLNMEAKDLATAIKLSYSATGNDAAEKAPIKLFCKIWDYPFEKLWPIIATPPERFPVDMIKKDYFDFSVFALAKVRGIELAGKTVRNRVKKLPAMVKLYGQDPEVIVRKIVQQVLSLSDSQTDAVMNTLRSTNYDWRLGVASESDHPEAPVKASGFSNSHSSKADPGDQAQTSPNHSLDDAIRLIALRIS